MNRGMERGKVGCAGVGSWAGRKVDTAHGAGLGEFFFFYYYSVFHFSFYFKFSNLQI
jgi:hypothetical protein